MKKLLLIRRIQTDKQWEQDCYKIAQYVANEANHNFPYDHYHSIFTQALAKYIADFEILLSNPIELLDVYDTVFKEGFNYSYTNYNEDNYFEFELNNELEEHLNSLIFKYTCLYYANEKSTLIQKLKNLDDDVIFIYPRQFYRNILKSFYSHNNPYFDSDYNNDDDCINDYLNKNNHPQYQIINI